MKIAICGSMQFSKEIMNAKQQLEKLGLIVTVQKNIEQFISGAKAVEDKWCKIEGDVLKSYYEEIKSSDAVIILNINKNNIENYVGGNTLIEMAFAHILDKKIYLLNPVPNMSYKDEIEAMHPVILNGNLSVIGKK